MQRKKACLRSGIIWLVRITIPRSATIWSMCCGSRFLSGFTSRKLYVRTCHVKKRERRQAGRQAGRQVVNGGSEDDKRRKNRQLCQP